MKFVIMKDPNGDHDFFAFPNTVKLDDFLECVRFIRNQTYGNWTRIHRSLVTHGTLDSNFEINECPEEFVEEVKKLKEAFVYVGFKFITTRIETLKGETNVFEMFLFPSHINHDCFGESILQMDDYRQKISAGFVRKGQRHTLECYGSSESLDLKCRVNEDNVLIQLQLQDRLN